MWVDLGGRSRLGCIYYIVGVRGVIGAESAKRVSKSQKRTIEASLGIRNHLFADKRSLLDEETDRICSRVYITK